MNLLQNFPHKQRDKRIYNALGTLYSRSKVENPVCAAFKVIKECQWMRLSHFYSLESVQNKFRFVHFMSFLLVLKWFRIHFIYKSFLRSTAMTNFHINTAKLCWIKSIDEKKIMQKKTFRNQMGMSLIVCATSNKKIMNVIKQQRTIH